MTVSAEASFALVSCRPLLPPSLMSQCEICECGESCTCSGDWYIIQTITLTTITSPDDLCSSNRAEGNFYEGMTVAGCTTDETDDVAQANIIAAGYKEET